ncbi:MAG: GIY-YIG nuclease family protein [bacterium]|nr:GIY-YIG nuclease family protein [Candidatus Jorgensenbacteria bacterium]
MYFVYILKSLKDNKHYVGLTSDISKRLEYHNKGRVRSTKSRRPFELIHTESFQYRMEARQREKFLKSYGGAKEKLSIIERLQN